MATVRVEWGCHTVKGCVAAGDGFCISILMMCWNDLSPKDALCPWLSEPRVQTCKSEHTISPIG